jgi:putative phage-type endonuclease
MSLGNILEVVMELLDGLYVTNHAYLFTGGLVDYCIDETFNLMSLTLCESVEDDDLMSLVELGVELLFISCWLPRERTPTTYTVTDVDSVLEALAPYKDQRQGTEKWHKFRHEHLTASSIGKVLMSEASFIALVRSKCSAPDMSKALSVNLNSTLHWGHKYEPVSIMIYEHDNNTRVGEFGCIPCQKNPFIAASPDGINLDPTSNKYGRMLEVKNIVNRDITGIPKPEYWIQMQVQMSVCGLPICDFLETRFKELESRLDMFHCIDDGIRCGCMSLFMNGDGKLYYQYAPIAMKTITDYAKWNEETMEQNKDSQWVKNTFWKLDEMLVTEVRFDTDWYKSVFPDFQKCWHTVLRVRNGEETLPEQKKRKPALLEENAEAKKYKCLL